MTALAVWVLVALPAGAETCRLALVLGLDVSSSVDEVEYDLQRVGLAAALDAPEVRHAILSGGAGAVAFSAYEWSGRYKQKVLLDWTMLRTEEDIDRAVEALAASVRSETEFPTAMGYGIGYGARMLARAPVCDRRVMDVSGDGVNNDGFGPRIAYRHFPLGGVTVNGLVILGHDAEVVEFYRDQVIRGRNAFLETANGFEDFRNAMTRKLYREINDIMLGRAIPPKPRG